MLRYTEMQRLSARLLMCGFTYAQDGRSPAMIAALFQNEDAMSTLLGWPGATRQAKGSQLKTTMDDSSSLARDKSPIRDPVSSLSGISSFIWNKSSASNQVIDAKALLPHNLSTF